MKKTIAYAYIGGWQDETLGWVVPRFLSSSNTLSNPEKPCLKSEDNNFVLDSDQFYLCKVVITPIKVKPKGRKLVRSGGSIRRFQNQPS